MDVTYYATNKYGSQKVSRSNVEAADIPAKDAEVWEFLRRSGYWSSTPIIQLERWVTEVVQPPVPIDTGA